MGGRRRYQAAFNNHHCHCRSRRKTPRPSKHPTARCRHRPEGCVASDRPYRHSCSSRLSRGDWSAQGGRYGAERSPGATADMGAVFPGAGKGGWRRKISEVFTSEKALALLHFWHLSFPTEVIRKPSAFQAARPIEQAVAAAIAGGAMVPPESDDEEQALIQALIDRAHALHPGSAGGTGGQNKRSDLVGGETGSVSAASGSSADTSAGND